MDIIRYSAYHYTKEKQTNFDALNCNFLFATNIIMMYQYA